MRLKIVVFSVVVLAMNILLGCDKNQPLVCRQDLYVRFVNSSGENLIDKYNVEIDSSNTKAGGYFLKESGYSLSLKINGVEAAPFWELACSGSPLKGLGSVRFMPGVSNTFLKNQRDPYTYEYIFVCPKLFKTDKPQNLTVVWGTKRKTMYDLVKEVRFNGELIEHNDEKNQNVRIVLE